MLGFDDAEDLIGTDARSLYAGEEQRASWIEALDDGGEIRNFELHLRQTDGRSVWTLMKATLREEDLRTALRRGQLERLRGLI